MKHTLRNLTIAAAFATSFGTVSTAATTDLAFIMDASGSVGSTNYSNSMTALANALTASIPTDDPDNQYSITVITFSNTARLDVGPTLVTDATSLGTVTSAITGASFIGSTTNYSAAFSLLGTTVTTLNDNSIINMMTDGNPFPNSASTNGVAESADLRTDGWDSLSFEAVGDDLDTANLASLAFDTLGVGGQPVFADPNQITDPLQSAFVLEVSDFGDAYTAAINNKVARIVDPDPISSVPVPAALPLLLAGLGMFGALRLRKSKTASA